MLQLLSFTDMSDRLNYFDNLCSLYHRHQLFLEIEHDVTNTKAAPII